MATQFTQQAADQLTPAYGQQISGLQSQIPAIQQLYSVLNQGLVGQQQTGNQNILEDASGRGLLKSTIPVDQQTTLGGQILQQQGTYAAQQAKEIGGVQAQVGGLQVDQANAVAQLASALQSAFTQSESARFERENADREYQAMRQLADRQYALDVQAARGGFR